MKTVEQKEIKPGKVGRPKTEGRFRHGLGFGYRHSALA